MFSLVSLLYPFSWLYFKFWNFPVSRIRCLVWPPTPLPPTPHPPPPPPLENVYFTLFWDRLEQICNQMRIFAIIKTLDVFFSFTFTPFLWLFQILEFSCILNSIFSLTPLPPTPLLPTPTTPGKCIVSGGVHSPWLNSKNSSPPKTPPPLASQESTPPQQGIYAPSIRVVS